MRALALVLLLIATPASAHPLAPALLELRQTGTQEYSAQWRTSTTRAGRNDVAPQWPESCTLVGQPRAGMEQDAWVLRQQLRCDADLSGQTIGVSGLAQSRIAVILRLQRTSAEVQQLLLDAAQPAFRIPERTVPPAVFPSYFSLGVEHLLLGPDHLLFVAGLVLLIRGLGPLVLTITAFTLGHSLTLALATLGLVRVNPALTEVGIALSLLLLALEAARPAAERQKSLLLRRPWLMASSFGLLHGLGFAGALGEIGLPAADIPLALLAFNLGIEAGQLLALAALLVLGLLWRRWPQPLRMAPLLPAYVMGTLAAYWCYERAAPLFS